MKLQMRGEVLRGCISEQPPELVHFVSNQSGDHNNPSLKFGLVHPKADVFWMVFSLIIAFPRPYLKPCMQMQVIDHAMSSHKYTPTYPKDTFYLRSWR